MNLPFSVDDFLDVFAEYNSALWPIVIAFWIATAIVAFRCLHRIQGNRIVFVLLAVHWAWSGIVYHWVYFRPINPAATFFGAFFLIQSALFAFFVVKPRGYPRLDTSLRGIVGGFFVLYALLYPLLALYGHEYPRMPVFAVPCPTVLFTAGVLLLSTGTPKVAYVIPLLWTAIAGSAAILLHIPADLALWGAGMLLMLDMVVPNALGTRSARQKSPAIGK